MITVSDAITLGILVFLCTLLTVLLNYALNRKNKKQLDKIFIAIFGLMIFWILGLILQIFCVNVFNAEPIYFDYFVYIGACFLPIAFLLMAIIFAKTKINYSKKIIMLFIIPIISLIVLWTNNLHHLFYVEYSTNTNTTVFGPYFYVHSIYTYLIYGISLFILMRYSIKNSGFFSKQAILILVGALIPIVTNVLGYLGIVQMSIYITPITFTFTIICFSLAIFKLNLFKVTPIALQRIVDRISDSYVILNDSFAISDYNQTFIITFRIKNAATMRGKNFDTFLKENKIKLNLKEIKKRVDKVKNNEKTESFRLYVEKIDKYFNTEISTIMSNGQSLGTLLLFKDITQHIEDMENLKDSQSILMEKERLATLGQMIGGVAHNLKTPIMSIAGATEGLDDLVNEYEKSVGDPDVTVDDHHAIASDMRNWISKIRSYDNYMSDIITAVKGQAVNMNEDQNDSFTIEELISRINILMKHELKEALVTINEQIEVDKHTKIYGNVNSLVQVVNNLISNAIQSYGPADTTMQVSRVTGSSFIKGDGADLGSGKKIGQRITDVSTTRSIDLVIAKKSGNIIISVIDHGCGMSKEIQNKLFKEMITTKGHNGSGLGLFMSYSTIKGNFQGDMNFTSELGKGTQFNVILPIGK